METKLFEYVEDGVIENPHYEGHNRGRNWVCKITGKNSVTFERHNVKFNGKKIDTSAFAVGDCVEMGGDYISGGGVRRPNRGYYLINSISEKGIECEVYSSIATLLKARKQKGETKWETKN